MCSWLHTRSWRRPSVRGVRLRGSIGRSWSWCGPFAEIASRAPYGFTQPTGSRQLGLLTRLVTTVARSGLRTACSPGGGGRSERVLNRRIQEVAVLVRPRLPDELAGEEMAVARIAEQVTREVIGGQQIRLGADVTCGGQGPRPEHGSRLVVERIAIGRAPEGVLLERKRQVANGRRRESRTGADDVLPPDVVDVPEVRVAIRIELVEGADVSAGLAVAARVIELEVDPGGYARDRHRVAEHGGCHRGRDVAAADRPELGCAFDLEVQARGADLAPRAAAEGVSSLASGGAVERGGGVVAVEPVEVQVHGQEVKRAGAEDTEERVIRCGLVEPVLLDDRHRLGPEGNDGPVRDPDACRTAIEGARDLREIARPDQPLGTEDQLLTATAQRRARLLTERNHDVREAIQEVELVHERRCPAPLEISVQREREIGRASCRERV